EAYAFEKGSYELHVVWTMRNETTLIDVPATLFVRASTWDGTPLTPLFVDGSAKLPASFDPIYVLRRGE
ncbi:MAG TPA: hypothetical protein VER55_07840, partial [Ardenticatenaceae bacterium]|nr:hypothetical protein [Ardenticatenaceae bacterium]